MAKQCSTCRTPCFGGKGKELQSAPTDDPVWETLHIPDLKIPIRLPDFKERVADLLEQHFLLTSCYYPLERDAFAVLNALYALRNKESEVGRASPILYVNLGTARVLTDLLQEVYPCFTESKKSLVPPTDGSIGIIGGISVYVTDKLPTKYMILLLAEGMGIQVWILEDAKDE